MKKNLLGLGLNTGMPVTELAKLSRNGERKGFDSIWLSEDPYLRDALPLMSVIALNTSNVKIATGIVNVYTKHPVYMAMAATTLDEISHGRLILGVGRGVKSLIEGELGINYGSPTDFVREYLTCLRRLLSGETVTFRGRMVRMTNARLHYDPLRADIPVLLAAMGPKTIRLAGKYGNGMIMNSCSSVRFAKYARKTLGRPPQGSEEPELACSLWVSIDEDLDKAYDSVRKSVGFLLSIPTFGELFLGKSGLPMDSLADLRRLFRWDKNVGDPMWHFGQADPDKVNELVDDRTVDSLTVCGPDETCRKRIREYHEAGVSTAIVNPMTAETFAKMAKLV